MGRYEESLPVRIRQIQDDKDPTKWPVAPGARVYMIDCERCGARYRPIAAGAHQRRCNGA